MDCAEAKAIVLNLEGAQVPADRRRQARAHVAACRQCQAGLDLLLGDITLSESICAEVQDLLPVYVDEELAAEPVRARYPHIWQHLHECSRCRRAHAELHELLDLERSGKWVEPSRYPAVDLPFVLPIEPMDGPFDWAVEATRDLQGYLAVLIKISRAYIQDALFPKTPSWARSGNNAALRSPRVPLVDSLLEESSWLLTVESLRTPGASPGSVDAQLQVSLVSPAPTGRVQVRITDGTEERTAVMDEAGVALFHHLPPTWLAEGTPGPAELNIYIEQIAL
jgi:hypothetical protein